MSKHRVLSFKPQLRLEWRGQDGQHETEQPDHSASLGDSIASSTQIRFSVHTGRLSNMNDLAAAVGLVQLRRINNFLSRRRQIVRTYDGAFAGIPWLQLPPPSTEESAPYFYWLQTPVEIRDKLANYLRKRGIYSTFRYWPLHRTSLYADSGSYPGADLAADTTLLLPMHQNLSDSDVDRIVETVLEFKI